MVLSKLIVPFVLIFSIHTRQEKAECSLNNHRLYGRVQVVDSFPDLKVQVVNAFPDLKVKVVESNPTKCGEWKIVSNFPDLKIQFVNSFPDLKIQYVESFPGLIK